MYVDVHLRRRGVDLLRAHEQLVSDPCKLPMRPPPSPVILPILGQDHLETIIDRAMDTGLFDHRAALSAERPHSAHLAPAEQVDRPRGSVGWRLRRSAGELAAAGRRATATSGGASAADGADRGGPVDARGANPGAHDFDRANLFRKPARTARAARNASMSSMVIAGWRRWIAFSTAPRMASA